MLISKAVLENHLIDAMKITNAHPAVLTTKADLLAVGDVHGDLQSVERAFGLKSQLNLEKIVFLGDYVDRGTQQIEVINRLCEMIIEDPKNVMLLRGNHEDLSVCNRYGFHGQLSAHNMLDLWDLIGQFFSSLPIFLHQKNNALFVHGGIPKTEDETPFNLEDIRKRGPRIPFNNSLEAGALWNDPFEATGLSDSKDKHQNNMRFDFNPRGPGCDSFSEFAVQEVLAKYDLKTLVRAHMLIGEGYRWYNKVVLSIHSSSSGKYQHCIRAYAECRIDENIKIHH